MKKKTFLKFQKLADEFSRLVTNADNRVTDSNKDLARLTSRVIDLQEKVNNQELTISYLLDMYIKESLKRQKTK